MRVNKRIRYNKWLLH